MASAALRPLLPCTIKVQGISAETSIEDIQQIFEHFGPICKAQMAVRFVPGTSASAVSEWGAHDGVRTAFVCPAFSACFNCGHLTKPP